MSRTRLASAIVTASVAVTGLAVAAPPAQAASSPVTTFTVLRPWSSTGHLQVKATVKRAPAGSGCWTQSISGRQGTYRCAIGNYIVDPAFKSPKAKNVAVLDTAGHWTVYTGVSSFYRQTRPYSARIWRVKLTNGAVCQGATGSYSAGPGKFIYGAGYCTGGAYGSKYVTWRATLDDGKNANYPLLALNSARTKWAAAVEYTKGKVALVPVTVAYR